MTSLTREMEPLAEEATRLLKALAHPARLIICCALKDREMSVGDMEATLGVRQPRLSRELAKLREEGLVETRRESKVIFYRLNDARACDMVEAIGAVMLAGHGDIQKPKPQSPPPSLRSGGYGVFARVGEQTAGRGEAHRKRK